MSGAINHTGIVSSISGNKITTIEGNTSNQVAERTYYISDDSIAGYGLPKYIEEIADEPIEQEKFTPYKVKITAKKLNVRAQPDIDSPVIKVLVKDEIVDIIAEENSFGKIGNEDGWIMLAYTRI